MFYRNFQGEKISALGMGCMRLPVCHGNDSEIDKPKAREILKYALDHGINYFDTAWGYHGGNSEIAVGEILSEFDRSSFYLASKFPGYMLSSFGKENEIFEQQKVKCKTDYFDFYLMHNVCEMNIEQYLDPKYGSVAFFKEKKNTGEIRHLGFSCHGLFDCLERFLDAYGDCMEFCQLQINWVDWNFQQAAQKLELLRKYNIPVIIMEPVRGGELIKLRPQYEQKLREMAPNRSNAEWAFRYLHGIKDAVVTLSGMSTMEQLKENLSIYETEQPLTEDETALLHTIAHDMIGENTLPCTACHYCLKMCPKELDIPSIISIYNESIFTEGGFIPKMYFASKPKEQWPSACIACGACASVCPQKIDIPAMMQNFAKTLS